MTSRDSTTSPCTASLIATVRASLNNLRAILGARAPKEEASAQVRQLELLEQLLLDQDARLCAIDRVLEEFNYSVAHELCAPLRRISGFTRELKQRWAPALEADGLARLDRILESSQQMNELIDALLQISRLAHVELQIVPVDLSRLAQEASEEFTQYGSNRSVQFRVQAQVSDLGDPALLKIALRKLIGNAWKFTAGRQPSVIEFGRSDEYPHAFYVRDNGVGFPSNEAARLFHPFQKLHDAIQYPGNGIGLTTVRKIIERHGGRVWAEGAPEAGATFFFTLHECD